ncbi:cupin domain-containing protein [Streptomyces sp. NPDC001339]|uniref:cupin domain-containing protein n=1 Tax=Streptomyces sp. NPDC001339 TaxID=3364563 RepID=UPI0036BDE36D
MLIRQTGEEQLTDAYGIRYQQIYPDGGEALAPWGVGRAVVEPGGSTEPHSHEDHEMFVFLSGRGVLTVDGEEAPVHPEVTALLPAGSTHAVKNSSDTERLVFLSVYWPVSHGPIDL